MKRILALFIISQTWISCSDPTPTTTPPKECTTQFVGDMNGTAKITVLALQLDNSTLSLSDGDDIPIVGRVSQGGVGTLILTGVKIENMNACQLQLTATLKDDAVPSGQIRLDSRTINLETLDSGLTAESVGLSTFANIPICPNQWSSRNLFDLPYLLEVTVDDKDGRSVTTTLHVVPTCVEAISTCQNICCQGYPNGTCP